MRPGEGPKEMFRRLMREYEAEALRRPGQIRAGKMFAQVVPSTGVVNVDLRLENGSRFEPDMMVLSQVTRALAVEAFDAMGLPVLVRSSYTSHRWDVHPSATRLVVRAAPTSTVTGGVFGWAINS